MLSASIGVMLPAQILFLISDTYLKSFLRPVYLVEVGKHLLEHESLCIHVDVSVRLVLPLLLAVTYARL